MGEISKSHATGAGICGIFILLCGLGDTIMGILWITKLIEWGVIKTELYGSGLYSGVPMIIAGALGIAVWPKRNRGLMVGFLVMCIIACILAAIQAIVAGLVFGVLNLGNCFTKGSGCESNEIYKFLSTSILVWLVMSSLGAIMTLAGSIFGCMSTCCASNPSGGTVVVQQPMGRMTMNAYDRPPGLGDDNKY